MALAKKGNALTSAQLLRNWTFENDGYGLFSGRATYRVDKAQADNVVLIGSAHPNEPNMFVQKRTVRYDGLDYVTIDAQYVGIGGNGGPGTDTVTRPNITGSTGLTSEHVTTHDNFFASGEGADPIAGDGTTFTPSTIVPGEYVGGVYGAHFKRSNGGEFTGFKDGTVADVRRLFYGKTHYLAPTTSFSGVVYIKDNLALCKAVLADVGKSNSVAVFGGVKMLPDWLGPSFVNAKYNLGQLLLTQANFEDYCLASDQTPKIVKVNYEIKYLRDGYPTPIYPESAV